MQTDCVIIGQGLAGTTLAWQLRWLGISFVVIDRDEAITTSRIAAGLMTPVTGQRVVPTARLAEFWPAAIRFYRRIEAEVGDTVFQERGHVRLFASEREADRFRHRDLSDIPGIVGEIDPALNPQWFENSLGGFEMPRAGQLAVAKFLDASRDIFERDGCWLTGNVDPTCDIELTHDGVWLARLGVEARRAIFCQGFEASRNPLLSHLTFDATRGEILTVRVPGLLESRIVNQGVWLAPSGQPELFRAGSTYNWELLEVGPTDSGRDWICERLRRFLKLPFEVVEHSAAVRPILAGKAPVLGLLSGTPQIGVFNGLGSKGSLQAPLLSAELAGIIVETLASDGAVYDASRRDE